MLLAGKSSRSLVLSILRTSRQQGPGVRLNQRHQSSEHIKVRAQPELNQSRLKQDRTPPCLNHLKWEVGRSGQFASAKQIFSENLTMSDNVIVHVNDESHFPRAIDQFNADLKKGAVFSFDCEMINNMSDVVLVQVATLMGRCFVFDMRNISSAQTKELAMIFMDNKITKFGSGCAYDVMLLNKLFDFNITNFFEFANLMVKTLSYEDLNFYLGPKHGLKTLCNKLMGFEFAKLHWAQYAKFTQNPVPDKLIKYAALDVLTLIDLYLILYFYYNKINPLTKEEIVKNSIEIANFCKRWFKPKDRSLSSIRSNFKY